MFFPLLTLQGLEGKLFTPVALTIVFALAGSLLLSLTVIPVLSSYLLARVKHTEPWLPRKLEAIYIPVLNWCLGNPRWVVGGAAFALVITAVAYANIGKSFMPPMDEGDIIVQLEKLPSITLDNSVDMDLRVEEAILARVPEVKRIVARVGSDEIGMDPMGLNETDIFMVLGPKTEWRMRSKDELIEAIRVVLEDFPGVAYGFTQPIEMRTSEMLTGVRGDVAAKLFGPDLEVLNDYAAEIAEALRQVDGSEDVFTSQNEGVQYFELEIDRLTAGRLGLDVEASSISCARSSRAAARDRPGGCPPNAAGDACRVFHRRISRKLRGVADLPAGRSTGPAGFACPDPPGRGRGRGRTRARPAILGRENQRCGQGSRRLR